MRVFHFVGAVALAGMIMFAGAPMAKAESIESKLHTLVKELNEEQQAALYLLLSQLKGGSGEAAAAPASEASLEDQAKAGVQAFVDAAAKGDIDGMMSFISDDFEHYQYGDKAGLRDFLSQAHDMGYLEGLEVDMDGVEIEQEGNNVILYPVEIIGVFGSATFEYVLKEENGQWRVIEFDATGI